VPGLTSLSAGRRRTWVWKAGAPQPLDLPDSGFRLEEHVQSIERGYLAAALRRAGGVQSRAAEILGMSFRSFRYYAKKYNLK